MATHGRRAQLALRALVVLGIGAVVEAALAVASIGAAADLRALPGRPAGDLAEPLADTATVMALLAWTWLLLLVVTTAGSALRSAGRQQPEGMGRHLAPRAARQAVLALLGVGTMLTTSATVSAAPAGYDAPRPVAAAGVRWGVDGSARAHPLEGLPLPDRPSGAGRPETPPRDARAAAVVVRPGDSLWAIAARALGDHPSTAAIARSWPRWYAANRAVIGDNPDLLLPGTVLEAPPQAARTPHPMLPPDERP